MSVTIHNIVVGVGAKTNIQSEITKMMNRLKANIENNNEDFIDFVTRQTMFVAKLETQRFRFRGDLENSIAHRIFKKTKRGEVFIKSDQIQKAIMNEFGQIPPHFVLNTGKMEDWVQQKAPQLMDKELILVGGPRGNVHAPNPKNRFWGVTQEIIAKDIDNMFASYLEKTMRES